MPSILVVDDDQSIRVMLARALRALGDVEQAGGGVEALKMLETKRYDCILLDLHMPGIDGFAVLQSLHAKPNANRDTPLIVITADPSDKARAQAFAAHAVFFVNKPLQLATLSVFVTSALQKSKARPS
jgi:CheY-like chemotaxis protein